MFKIREIRGFRKVIGAIQILLVVKILTEFAFLYFEAIVVGCDRTHDP
jgi:hypothetical protein